MVTVLVPTLTREAAAWAEGRLLVGVDEVGRGPLAGPVVAAAVVFPAGCPRLRGLRDSKVLAPVRRERLAAKVRMRALAIGIGAASVAEIDRLNIRVASALAMRRAIMRCRRALVAARGDVGLAGHGQPPPASQPAAASADWRIIIDGLPLPEIGVEHDALVDGDARCHSIAAAAVVAKSVRDALMRRLALRYPGYGWDTNVGYATDAHHQGLRLHGATRHHRLTFAPVAQLDFSL